MPKKQCAHAGCGELIQQPATRCEKHQKLFDQQREAKRKNSNARGYGYKWRKARAGFLAANPLCVRCEADGITEEATVVDHIEPHRGDMALFWDRANWQPLCKRCHDHKTATEDGGFSGFE